MSAKIWQRQFITLLPRVLSGKIQIMKADELFFLRHVPSSVTSKNKGQNTTYLQTL
jgi:hypothetical protein